MDLIDNEIKTSFRLNRSREKHHVRDSYRFGRGARIFLDKRNIVIPLSGALGDSLKVFDGSVDDDWVSNASRTELRANGDFWLDDTLGILHIRNFGFFHNYLAVDISYRYNEGARATLSGALTISGTTVNVDSTVSGASQNFPLQGSFRIGQEEIRFNTKNSTSFTAIERGSYNTTSASHSDGDVVFWVPKDIQEACTKLVAIDITTSGDYGSGGSASGDLPSNQITSQQKIDQWKEDIEKTFSRYRPVIMSTR